MSDPIRSNPISPNSNQDAVDPEPELEVDELLEGDSPAPLLEVDPIDDNPGPQAVSPEAIPHWSENSTDETGGPDPAPETADQEDSRKRSGLITLVLAGALLFSIAINLNQSRSVASLETRSAELEQALGAAVERIDAETARANGAEAALERVDNAVDVVNEKVLGLQEALDGLREATVR